MKSTRPSGIALAICAGSIAAFLAAPAQAQITFTTPADAPAGGVGTVGILEVTNAGGVGSQEIARNNLMSGAGTRLTGTAPNVDYFNTDNAARARFPGDRPFLSDPSGVAGDVDDINDIAVLYRGTVNIPTTGDYTFGVNSDDGFTLAFDNGATPFTGITAPGGTGASLQTFNGGANGAFQYFDGRGATDSLATINLTAGNHPFILAYHEGGGGSGVELFASSGVQSAFNPATFNLVGGQAFTIPARTLGTVGTFDYVRINGSTNLGDAIARYNNNAPTGDFLRTAEPTVNFIDPEGANDVGGKNPQRPFPGNTPANEDNFGGAARVTLTLAAGQTGRYTFDIASDDSFRFRIFAPGGVASNTLVPLVSNNGANSFGIDTNGDAINDAFTNDGSCCADGFGRYDLTTPGTYTLEAIFNEQGGGAGFFIFGAQGDLSTFGPAFQLVGAPDSPATNVPAGLQLVPEPTSMMLCAFGAAALGLRRRRK